MARRESTPLPAGEDPGIPSAQGERTASRSAHPARQKIRPDARPYGMQAIDLIAELVDSAERPLTFPASKLPHENARRLLELMGVAIVEDVVVSDRPRLSDDSAAIAPSQARRTSKNGGGLNRRGDERPRDELVRRKVVEALERSRARGQDGKLELQAEEWAA